MSFLRRLFSGGRGGDEAADETPVIDDRQQVAVWVRLSDPSFENEREQMRMYGLEDRLIAEMEASGVGTYDTNDLESGYLRMSMVGPDADRIIEAIRPILADAPPGSYLAVRRGPTGTSEEREEVTVDG